MALQVTADVAHLPLLSLRREYQLLLWRAAVLVVDPEGAAVQLLCGFLEFAAHDLLLIYGRLACSTAGCVEGTEFQVAAD